MGLRNFCKAIFAQQDIQQASNKFLRTLTLFVSLIFANLVCYSASNRVLSWLRPIASEHMRAKLDPTQTFSIVKLPLESKWIFTHIVFFLCDRHVSARILAWEPANVLARYLVSPVTRGFYWLCSPPNSIATLQNADIRADLVDYSSASYCKAAYRQ